MYLYVSKHLTYVCTCICMQLDWVDWQTTLTGHRYTSIIIDEESLPQDQVINKWTNMSPLVLTRGSAASSRYHKIYTIYAHTHTHIYRNQVWYIAYDSWQTGWDRWAMRLLGKTIYSTLTKFRFDSNAIFKSVRIASIATNGITISDALKRFGI